GLNLTRAALDAATKYPWPRSGGRRKFGVYADDLAVFEWLRAGRAGEERCFEAQVMDWADDVAYSVHDVEDGVHSGHIDLTALRSTERPDLVALAAAWYAPEADLAELEAALDRLLELPYWPSGYDGTLRSLAALKNLTSQLIGRFCSAAEAATRQAFGTEALTRYRAGLVVPDGPRLEVAVLKALANLYVMQREGAEAYYAGQRELVQELVGALGAAGPDALEPAFRGSWDAAGDDAARLRVVVDQVASLTDRSIGEWHRRLCGSA
ncbi:MAG TPA: hypothetical protein VF770_02685, partial [Solirubrobacterales bacterium]